MSSGEKVGNRFISSRGRLGLLVLGLLIAVGLGIWFGLTQEPDQTLGWRNYSRIKAGMTRAEVEAILGGPEGPVGHAPDETWFVALTEQEGPMDALGGMKGKPAVWYNDRGQIIVLFDSWDESGRASGHVVGKQLYHRAK